MARIGTKPLAQLLRRIGTSLRAGIDTRTLWEKESQRGVAGQCEPLAKVSAAIAGGNSLAAGLRACGDYFPSLVCDLVDVGERTGRLEEVLLMLADHYDHLLDLRRAFLMGIIWPAIQLGVAVGVIGLLIWVMGALGGGVDILGFGLVGTSGLIKYLLLVGVVAGVITWFVLALFRGWLGPKPMELALQIPVIGGCLKTAALSRFAWTLSLTLDSGLDAQRAIRLALRSTQNAYYTAHTEAAERAIRAGREFHEALSATGVFPGEFLSSLETAELAGTPGETMQRLANEYRERAKTSAKALTVASTIAVWGLVAAALIFLIFRVALFYVGTINDALKGI
jgi:type IV pilus assembly protein PilC